MTFPEKLSAIRAQMAADDVAAYIIPSADPHISEYLPAHYRCIPFVTGFTGSVSTVVITADFAGLWTDSRYFEQATAQLMGSGFELVKLKAQGMPEYISWIGENLSENAKVAFDEKLMSVSLGEQLQQQLAFKKIDFEHHDYLSPIWENRPPLPENPAVLIDEEFTGRSAEAKLSEVRGAMALRHTDAHLISALDDLAWLFNLRGADVNYNPVALAFALITKDYANLYIQSDKFNENDLRRLAKAGVSVLPYGAIENDLRQLPLDYTIWVDPKKNCLALDKLIPATVRKVRDANPAGLMKASKNETEIAHIREAMIKDGVAITKFLKWITDRAGREEITEISAAAKLRDLRAEQEGFIGESFNTIAAYRAHAALPHYGTTSETNVTIQAEGLFLVDSGGQYRYGTTDITRVIPLGNTTDEEATDYTLVLKAMINGCRLRFPQGTYGYQVDAITRNALWEHHLNFGHGTGHGVGYFLNVHEGPQIFNTSPTAVPIALGMITSIEPGLYRPGKHGIRIENLVLAIEDQSNEFNTFYAFETLTLAPIDTSIVKNELLEKAQIDWLNAYHENVYAKLSPFLDAEHQEYLANMTRRIS